MDTLQDIIILASIGLIAGLLSGMLGIGGGIVMVPSLYEWFNFKSLESLKLMQLSTGTALSAMVVTSLVAGLSHRRIAKIRWDLVFILAPGTICGGLIGVQLADHIPSLWLKKAFAVLLLCVAIQLLFFPPKANSHQPKMPLWSLRVVGLGIGMCSGMLGLGGGVIIIPFLLFNGIVLSQASAVALWCTLPTVCAATAMAVYTGYNEPSLPAGAIGFVYWPATLAMGVMSAFIAPLGAWLAHYLPRRKVSIIFALVVAGLSIRMMVV